MGVITLETITLNKNMRWIERHALSPVAQQVRRTVSGGSIIFAGAQVKGQTITLEATEDFGWLQQAEVTALEVLAVVPGAVYTLTIGVEVFSVSFRHNEPPAVDMSPLIHRLDEEVTDYFIGQLKFITR